MAFRWQWPSSSIGKPRWWVDERIEYGEARMITLAPATEILYCVTFVDRGRARRIINLRRANRREVKHYVQST